MNKRLYKKRIDEIENVEDVKLRKILIFYLQTSAYTFLGPYADFARSLPDDIEQLCVLQRLQTIHAKEMANNPDIRKEKDNINGDMTKFPIDRLNNEEDIFQTASSIFAELLRRDSLYSTNREAKNKICIVCRGHALMLASVLKSKGIPTRVRVGFSKYHNKNEYDDQWNIEYYSIEDRKWHMADASEIGVDGDIKDQITDIPKEKFLTAAEAWTIIRKDKLAKDEKIIDSGGYEGLKAVWLQLMNDFNCIMNNEKSFLFQPRYMYECVNGKYLIRDFTDEELNELDELSELMMNIDDNIDTLYRIYMEQPKFKVMLGISSWN